MLTPFFVSPQARVWKACPEAEERPVPAQVAFPPASPRESARPFSRVSPRYTLPLHLTQPHKTHNLRAVQKELDIASPHYDPLETLALPYS